MECHEAIMALLKEIPRIHDKESLIKGIEDVDFIMELAKLTLRTSEGVIRRPEYDVPSVYAILTNLLRCIPEGSLQGIRTSLEEWKMDIFTAHETDNLYAGNTWARGNEIILKSLRTMTTSKFEEQGELANFNALSNSRANEERLKVLLSKSLFRLTKANRDKIEMQVIATHSHYMGNMIIKGVTAEL